MSCQCLLHRSSKLRQCHSCSRAQLKFTASKSVRILFLTNKCNILHIQHAAAKTAFLACCLDILAEATYFLYNTRWCLFVILFVAFVASLLCLLPLAPSWILSSCLNADWIPALVTWLLYFQISLMLSLVGENHFINTFRDSYLVFFLHICLYNSSRI